ncbi:hypothetical protein PTI98_012963 [Pleurotus ostreatus]|nr:hypothetical protein PTI98_012963 [Pleurotus ostreatus]
MLRGVENKISDYGEATRFHAEKTVIFMIREAGGHRSGCIMELSRRMTVLRKKCTVGREQNEQNVWEGSRSILSPDVLVYLE